MSITSHRLYFSRTKEKDYRWIYIADQLSENELEEIKSSYETLLYEFFRKDIKHLIIQRIEKGFVIYRLVDTELKDNWGIAIYAITGLFYPFNEKINTNLSLFITDWYFNFYSIYKEVLDEDKDTICEYLFSLDNLHTIIEAKDDSSERKFRMMIDNYLLDNKFEKGIRILEINSKYEIETLGLNAVSNKPCKRKKKNTK